MQAADPRMYAITPCESEQTPINQALSCNMQCTTPVGTPSVAAIFCHKYLMLCVGTGICSTADMNNPVRTAENSGAVAIMHATYSWSNEADSTVTLSDVTLTVPKGALCILVGTVGSGKSSLLAAMLGEMHCVRGTAAMHGTVAYTAQV